MGPQAQFQSIGFFPASFKWAGYEKTYGAEPRNLSAETCRKKPVPRSRWENALTEFKKHPSGQARARTEVLHKLDDVLTTLHAEAKANLEKEGTGERTHSPECPANEAAPTNPLQAGHQLEELPGYRKTSSTLLVEKIDLSKCALPPEEKDKLIDLLNEFKTLFSVDKEPGLITEFEFSIDTGDHPPIRDRARYLPKERYEALRVILQRLLRDGVCRPSSSSWASAVVMVPKDANRTAWRMCIDFRKLNALTAPDS